MLNRKIFICEAKDNQCQFTSECANHTTAGDFRSEHGLLPQVYLLDEERCVCKCLFADNVSSNDHYNFGEMLTYEQVKNDLPIYAKIRLDRDFDGDEINQINTVPRNPILNN